MRLKGNHNLGHNLGDKWRGKAAFGYDFPEGKALCLFVVIFEFFWQKKFEY
jgi:hypothetical protein